MKLCKKSFHKSKSFYIECVTNYKYEKDRKYVDRKSGRQI